MKCFHHDDLDGRCAGAIVSIFEKNFNKDDFYEVNYVVDLSPMLDDIQDGEVVYFVDYSFKENTKWVIDSLLEKNCDIIWIDHHTSSLSLIKEHPELNNIKGIREDGISGAALAYMYLYNLEYNEIPAYVKFVSDYDCWQFRHDPETTYFKLGIESIDYGALSGIWVDLEKGFDALHELIKNGKSVKTYIDSENIDYRNKFAYESIIGGYKALVVNRKTNSWIFGDKYKQYPLVCVWVFNGDRYSYSIFTDNKDIDCSKIAESYGGGGHAGAAGFSSDKLLFKRV